MPRHSYRHVSPVRRSRRAVTDAGGPTKRHSMRGGPPEVHAFFSQQPGVAGGLGSFLYRAGKRSRSGVFYQPLNRKRRHFARGGPPEDVPIIFSTGQSRLLRSFLY
jgi:hypothetical protein